MTSLAKLLLPLLLRLLRWNPIRRVSTLPTAHTMQIRLSCRPCRPARPVLLPLAPPRRLAFQLLSLALQPMQPQQLQCGTQAPGCHVRPATARTLRKGGAEARRGGGIGNGGSWVAALASNCWQRPVP